MNFPKKAEVISNDEKSEDASEMNSKE